MRSLLRALLPVLVAVPALSSCAVGVNPVTGAKRAYAYTWQQEIQLGRQADREIVEQFGVVDDPALQAYVERVGEAVLAVSHLRRDGALPEFRETAFTFRVLDSEIVNAFALPGGFVYVTRGLLAHLDSEAQLAVVLGHEIAHVAARHSSKDALKTGLVALGVAGASVLGDELGGVAGLLAELGGLGAQLLMVRHSRDDERESDALGVEYAARAGYDAAEGAHFFTALKRMQLREGWFPSFLSTHPDPGRREETVRRMAGEWAARGHAGRRVERDAFLARIDGLVLGEDPRQGFVEDGHFVHPAGRYRFPLPRGWGMEREGREVQFAPGQGSAAVLFNGSVRHATAAEAAAEFVREHELAGVSTSAPAFAGGRASRVDGTLRQGEESYRVSALWVEHGGEVRRFIGFSAPADARAMANALSTMVNGFRPLTERRHLDVRPASLEVVRVRRAAPFRELVGDRELPEGMDLEALAILNAVGVDEVLAAGRAVKLPRWTR
jgi:predicted Zn-dependent protease